MIEERPDNSIFVLGLLIAAALAFYGLWTEGNPVVIELVEQIKKHRIEYLPAEPITHLDKQVIYMTATPGPSIDTIVYGTPLRQLTSLDSADVVSTLRALTPVAPTHTPMPTWTLVPPPPPSTMPPLPTLEPTMPPPTLIPTMPPPPPTLVLTVPPSPPTLVLTVPPSPPTLVPTMPPSPPTLVPTMPPPPPTLVLTMPPSPTLVPQQWVDSQPGNPELAPTAGMARLQGQIDFVDASSLTLILTDGEYYGSVTTGDGTYSFENVPNGTYNLSVAGQSGCGQIEVSVPEGVATLTYNYRFYRMQCTLVP